MGTVSKENKDKDDGYDDLDAVWSRRDDVYHVGIVPGSAAMGAGGRGGWVAR